MENDMAQSRYKKKEYSSKDFSQEVADKFVEQLRSGTSPLQTPNIPGVNPTPVNPVTGRRFQGANNIQLRLSGYKDPRWVTFDQANKNGWRIKRGEKATKVQHWTTSKTQDKLDRDGNAIIGPDGKPKKETVKLERATVVYYGVFNAEQIDGIPELIRQEPERNPIDRAKALVDGMHFAKVADDALSRPYFSRDKDEIHMPPRHTFQSETAYYDALLTGAIHGTSHQDRLNRSPGVPGSQAFIGEKLRTELAAMMIAGEIGLPKDTEKISAHVDDLSRCVENHPMELLRAAGDASRISAYMFDRELTLDHEQAAHANEQDISPAQSIHPEQRQETSAPIIDIPLGSIGTFEVRGCVINNEDGEVQSYPLDNVQDNDLAQFNAYGVYTTLDDGTQAHIIDRETREEAMTFAKKAEEQYAASLQQLASEHLKDRPTAPERSPDKKADDRTYIKVPKWEKDEAKELGAKWDYKNFSWFVPAGVDISKFTKWTEREKSQEQQPAAKQFKREYIRVPADEHDQAEQAGAKWDRKNRGWYVMKDDGEAVARCEKWRIRENKPERCSTEPALSPEDEFRAALTDMGARPESMQGHPIDDGNFHRIEEQNDKSGEKSMSYKFYSDGRPAGFIQNNRTGEKANWKSKGHTLTPKKKEQLQAEAGKKLEERSIEEEKSRQEAVNKLSGRLEFFAGQTPGPFSTSYMEAKGIEHHPGVYRHHKEEHTMIVPAYNAQGELQSAQYVKEDGKKSFVVGTSKTGAFHVIGHGTADALKDAPAIVISEGYATAASISEAVGFPTVSAFDAGNLPHVAKALRERFPDKPIIMAADDDAHQKSNPGKNKAYAAAKAVDGYVALPYFTDEQKAKAEESGTRLTDFNDLASVHPQGKEGVKRQITNAMEKQKAHAARQQFQERSSEKTKEAIVSR